MATANLLHSGSYSPSSSSSSSSYSYSSTDPTPAGALSLLLSLQTRAILIDDIQNDVSVRQTDAFGIPPRNPLTCDLLPKKNKNGFFRDSSDATMSLRQSPNGFDARNYQFNSNKRHRFYCYFIFSAVMIIRPSDGYQLFWTATAAATREMVSNF